MDEPIKQLRAAETFAEANLKQLAYEILHWQECAELPMNSTFSELVNLCAFAGHMKFDTAESVVKNAALRKVAKP